MLDDIEWFIHSLFWRDFFHRKYNLSLRSWLGWPFKCSPTSSTSLWAYWQGAGTRTVPGQLKYLQEKNLVKSQQGKIKILTNVRLEKVLLTYESICKPIVEWGLVQVARHFQGLPPYVLEWRCPKNSQNSNMVARRKGRINYSKIYFNNVNIISSGTDRCFEKDILRISRTKIIRVNSAGQNSKW